MEKSRVFFQGHFQILEASWIVYLTTCSKDLWIGQRRLHRLRTGSKTSVYLESLKKKMDF